MSDAGVQDAEAPEAAEVQEVVAPAPEAAEVQEVVAPKAPEVAQDVAQDAVPEVVAPKAAEVAAEVPEAPVAAEQVPAQDAVSPIAKLTEDISFMQLFGSKQQEKEMGAREAVERGLQAFNAIPDACKSILDAVNNTDAMKTMKDSIRMRFNPEIGLLSDFVQHCKMLISIDGGDGGEVLETEISSAFRSMIKDERFNSHLLTIERVLIGDSSNVLGVQISLILKIGAVFNVPVFTVYIMQNVFNNANIDSDQNIIASPMTYNAKTISNCSRLDLMLELLLHATKSEPYEEVNPLISHSINELVVSRFGSKPNEVIQEVRNQFFELLLPNNELAKSLIVKAMLIAIIQNPLVKTSDGKRFFDMFPSGQYVKYLGEIAHVASIKPDNQGPIMLPIAMVAEEVGEAPGEAPGYEEQLPPRPSHPMTRTDIIVAAFTAANDAMGSSANIVAAGGAAVSYYIADFMKGMNADEFGGVIPESGLDVIALEALKKNCENIPMNDIDCFVFGEEVSRQFLLLFSLYMMILYANFYERPKRYGVIKPHNEIEIKFILSPQSSDDIKLFMYGNANSDANTRLISKRLKKNPKVQLVTQETKCFSQLSSMVCDEMCSVDRYFTQPIDLVKKEVDDFLILYESLYPDDQSRPDLRELLISQYVRNVDNIVSMKTTMLDLVCIFCNEDKALFIRIFMARKNPKDFSRLRVFIEIYLLYLLRANNSTFLEHKDELLREIKELRVMMTALNERYYLEQGNIAAVDDSTAERLIADRNSFLNLLRRIGRKIVLIPDPLNNEVPATFRKKTGKNTIAFFKDKKNAQQIKYPFKMDQHMFNLYETYTKAKTVDSSHANRMYNAWLNGVFEEIMFAREAENMFREKMMKIIDDTKQDQMFFQIGFADMPVMSSEMLNLLTNLNQVKIDEKLVQEKYMLRHQRRILPPLRKHIQGLGQPKASFVHKIVNKTLFPEFIKTLLKTDNQALLKTIDEPRKYDDAVNEAIGNIVLEWNQKAPELSRGGATRKRKRECKKNAHTRRTNKCIRRATRKNTHTHAGKGRHKRTHKT